MKTELTEETKRDYQRRIDYAMSKCANVDYQKALKFYMSRIISKYESELINNSTTEGEKNHE